MRCRRTCSIPIYSTSNPYQKASAIYRPNSTLPSGFKRIPAQTEPQPGPRTLPGKTRGGLLLPNGWILTPEGTQIPVSDLPLNMALSHDGRYLLVTTNGYGPQTINVIDLIEGRSKQ